MNTRMTKRTPIRDHLIFMIALFNDMKILGTKINKETLVDMILKTLSNSFKQFKLNNTMNKLMISQLELEMELQMVEGILKHPKGFPMAMKDSSGSSHNKKKNNSFKKSKQENTKARKSKSQGKGKCFNCGKKGHWKKESPDYLKKKEGISNSLLVESCLVVDSINSWGIDSKATKHVYNSLKGF